MITLKQKTDSGDDLEATFLPERGLNLVSFKRAGIEVIDQGTREAFEKSSNGLGPIIGPHFSSKPHSSDSSHGDNLYHGIGRYAPWQVQQHNGNKLIGTLTGKDTWESKTLAALEGQNFKMYYSAELTKKGLLIDLGIVSDTDSLIGIDFHYALPEGKGTLISEVRDHYYDEEIKLKRIPKEWNYSPQGLLKFDLSHDGNFAFHPLKNPLNGKITLLTSSYQLEVRYNCDCQENSWQLYRPKREQYVCINPISSQNPWKPNLSVSSIQIELEVVVK